MDKTNYRFILVFLFILLCALLAKCIDYSNNTIKETGLIDTEVEQPKEEIKGIVTHVTLTCYQPVKSQCDDSPLITADNSQIDLNKLKNGQLKWCAISRNLLYLFPKNKPKRVYIEGYGIYEVRDKMNKRYNHRLDILIHPDDDTRIMEKNVKVVILS